MDGATNAAPQLTQLSLGLTVAQQPTSKTTTIPIDRCFPEQAANELAESEAFNKHLYRPNTYLHKWWARRSGTTFRYILKQLVNNEEQRGFYASGGLAGQVILDPMMGGGTTLHEAIRMGANVIGVDLDPIPVVQARATLSLSSAPHKQDVFDRFLDFLSAELAAYYCTTCPTCGSWAEVQFVLHGLRRRCSCKEVVFVDSYVLRQNHGDNVNICPICRSVYTGQEHNCATQRDRPLIVKGTGSCDRCQSAYKDVIDEPFQERYVPLVVVGACTEHGQFFKQVEQRDLERIESARTAAREVRFGDAEQFRVPRGPKSDDLLGHRVLTFQDLFTPRQMIYLSTVLNLLPELSPEDRRWLGLLVSTSLEFNSLLCGYKGGDIRRPGAIRHVFSHHAYSFPYTALENNPVFSGKTSGTLGRLFEDRVLKAGLWAVGPIERSVVDGKLGKVTIKGEVDGGESVQDWMALLSGQRKFLALQADSSRLEIPAGIVDFVVTDPPYYDSVQYSDLSHFFRVWLRLLLPTEADWRYDPLTSAVSEGDTSGNLKYGEVLGSIWQRCEHALNKEHGRLIFTFHHWRHEAWAELTLSLRSAGFVLTNCYVVFSENPTSVHIKGQQALKHDAILVLRPIRGDGEVKEWSRPSEFGTADSYTFCQACGYALGWFLTADMEEVQIRAEWKRLVERGNNGKESQVETSS